MPLRLTWGKLDDAWWLQRFTPRGPKKINRGKALRLIEASTMKPAGLAEVERAKRAGVVQPPWVDPFVGAGGAGSRGLGEYSSRRLTGLDLRSIRRSGCEGEVVRGPARLHHPRQVGRLQSGRRRDRPHRLPRRQGRTLASRYCEIVPDRRIVYTYEMRVLRFEVIGGEPELPSASMSVVTITPAYRKNPIEGARYMDLRLR